MTRPERTPDGHHLVIDGRKWRATDPDLPEDLRADLVGELMSARRAVRAGRGDDAAISAARARVQDAKVALGERGHPWWEEPSDDDRRARLAAGLRSLARRRDEVRVPDVVGVDRRDGARDLAHEVATALVADGDLDWSGEDAVRQP